MAETGRVHRPSLAFAAGAILALGLWMVAGCAGQPAKPPPKVDASPYLSELQRLPVLGGGWIDGSQLAGKVVVVQFLATWCFPCIATAPRLQEIYDHNQARGLMAIAVGMDFEGPQVLRPFADQLGLRYPVLVADDALRNGQTAFGKVGLLPTTLIIGRDGRVVSVYAGVAEQGTLEPLIDEALRKPAPR
ncbi:MAG TPA: TlpA disulfide reductase family protein [Myxococcaceae bacterium]|jgi:thiol-disulfide isomerase/thioredoxin|nr:TlpA disulfide reductase family protein [Myxococcaceae bacterium]